MGFPAIGSVLHHPQKPVVLLSYQLGILLFLILLFPFTDPAFYGMSPICSLLLTPRSACAWHVFTVPGLKCTTKSLKKYDWGKSMKDSKWSMLASCKRLYIPHIHLPRWWVNDCHVSFPCLFVVRAFKPACGSVAHSKCFIFSLRPIFLFHSVQVISCHVVKLKPDADACSRWDATRHSMLILDEQLALPCISKWRIFG